MARRYRRRLFRRGARRMRMRKSRMSRIKKDILRCNFPTKVKFMGLTEKKVMYLTKSFTKTFKDGFSYYLTPLDTENISSIMNSSYRFGEGVEGRISNWDKICILGIYIKMQPINNMFQGAYNTDKRIETVKCTYTMNNVDGDEGLDKVLFDKTNIKNKQVFTFNSNEAFTIYVPAPTTMDLDSPVVHKSKTWWSLTNLVGIEPAYQQNNSMDEDGDDDNGNGNGNGKSRRIKGDEDSDEDDLPVYYRGSSPIDGGSKMHAGRLYFSSPIDTYYNITINYKVALKG